MRKIKYWDENEKIACDKEIEKCNKLEGKDGLFELWKNVQINIETEKNCLKNTGLFVHDGYIDEKEYMNSKKKILFILKESHTFDTKNVKQNREIIDDYQAEFYRSFFKLNRIIDNIPKQKEKMARMAKYILDKEITSDYKELCNALKQVAFMNINKMGGIDTTKGKELYIYYEKYKNFILKEINILNPKIIVIMTGDSKIADDLDNKINKNKKDKEKTKIIPMIHTATRGRNLSLDENEERYFNDNIAPNIGMNWNSLINQNYIENEDNVFNKGKNGPFLKFNKTTLKYLVKFIKRYNT